MRPSRMRSIGPPRTLTSAVGIPSLEHFKNGFRMQPSMVLHVTLEYTVPHMGFATALTYGGLGKVCVVPCQHTECWQQRRLVAFPAGWR